MSTLDIILVVGLAVSIIYSLIRGLIHEIFSLLSVIIGLLVAIRLYPTVAMLLSGVIEKQLWANITGFLIILIGVSLCISMLGKLVKKLIKASNLGLIDRIGGAVFGLVKGVAVAFFLIILLVAFLPPQSQILKTSKVVPQIIKVSTFILYVIPDDLKHKFQEKKVQLTEMWDKKYIHDMRGGGDRPASQEQSPEGVKDIQSVDRNSDLDTENTGHTENMRTDDSVSGGMENE